MFVPSTVSPQIGQVNERSVHASTFITVLSKRRHIHGGPIVRRVNDCYGEYYNEPCGMEVVDERGKASVDESAI